MTFTSVFTKAILGLVIFCAIFTAVIVSKGFYGIASTRFLLRNFTKVRNMSNSTDYPTELKYLPTYEQLPNCTKVQNVSNLTDYPTDLKHLPTYEQFLLKVSKNSGNSKLKCNTCAVVTNSGMLLHSKARKEIDSNDCVIRMNSAPTSGYEEDVGMNTTFRLFDHSAVKGVIELLKKDKSEQSKTILILIPDPKDRNENIKQISTAHPNSSFYCYGDELFKKAVEQFEEETGRLLGKTWLSCGWVSIVFAKEICGTINVFGMVEENYCEQVFSKKLKDTPYHYYNWAGLLQCAVYKYHKNWDDHHQASHRFMKEKGIFKKWAKESGNINFYHPCWNLTAD